MRPAGEIRTALRNAAPSPGQCGATWRDLAQRACVGYTAARRTVENMARAGELQPVGPVPVAGSRRPMTAYVAASTWPRSAPVGGSLDTVMRAWR